MSDASNEKAQFIMAAARIAKWKYATAVWGSTDMSFSFHVDGSLQVLPIDTTLAGWEDLSPTDKLGAAQSALQAAAAQVPTFDPTGPGWVTPTGPAA